MSELGFGFEIKAIDEAGYIAGVAAGYGNVDHGGDMIMPGALTTSVRNLDGTGRQLLEEVRDLRQHLHDEAMIRNAAARMREQRP